MGGVFPHEFSGGPTPAHRASPGRLLSSRDLIIADEPVSALDVSVQAQVLNLLQDLKTRLNLSMIFISHDLDVVELMCDRIIVLYLGKIMEVAPADELYRTPQHPYTEVALLEASPRPDPEARHARRLLQATSRAPGRSAVGLRLPDAHASARRSTPAQRPRRRCGSDTRSLQGVPARRHLPERRSDAMNTIDLSPILAEVVDATIQGLSAGCSRAVAARPSARMGLEPLRRRHAASAGGDPRFGADPQPRLDARLHCRDRRAAGTARQDEMAPQISSNSRPGE